MIRNQVRTNTPNKPEAAYGALLRLTKADWQLDCGHTTSSYSIEQQSEISNASGMGSFENSLSPGRGEG